MTTEQEQTEKTLAEFIAENDLRLHTEFVGKEKDANGWEHFAWRVTIINAKAMHQHSYTTEFRMGTAHQQWKPRNQCTHHVHLLPLPPGEQHGQPVSQGYLQKRQTLHVHDCLTHLAQPTPPSLGDVLDSLRSDAESVANARLFEDWAADLGYDTDSRKAEGIFRACQVIEGQLIKLLGHAAYADLTQNVERL